MYRALKATHILRICNIYAFPLQQCLRERASMLRCTTLPIFFGPVFDHFLIHCVLRVSACVAFVTGPNEVESARKY